MTTGEIFQKKAKYEHGFCSPMSNLPWIDLRNGFNVLRLHDVCGKSGCKCQKQLSSSSRQYMLESSGFGNISQNIFEGT